VVARGRPWSLDLIVCAEMAVCEHYALVAERHYRRCAGKNTLVMFPGLVFVLGRGVACAVVEEVFRFRIWSVSLECNRYRLMEWTNDIRRSE
jgi:hypothetical protein